MIALIFIKVIEILEYQLMHVANFEKLNKITVSHRNFTSKKISLRVASDKKLIR